MGEVPTTVQAARAERTRQALRALDALEHRLGDQHMPQRPEWDCLSCEPGTPWPCSPAQVRLAEAYRGDRVGLSMYAGQLLHAATQDRPDDDQRELHERIVGWIR